MSLALIVDYQHIFDDEKPEAAELLQDVPSIYVIGIMAMINESLRLRQDTMATQAFLVNLLSQQFPDEIRNTVMVRAGQRIQQGYTVFAYRYTVELINRELQHYRQKENVRPGQDNLHVLKIFKAYLRIVSEINERDKEVLNKAMEGRKAGKSLLPLMWPHLMRQYEFSYGIDPLLEIIKGAAFVSFLEGHPKFKEKAKQYFETMGCSGGQEYFRNLLALVLPSLERTASPNPLDYVYTIQTEQPEPVLESLVIDPYEVADNPEKQFDYLGMKEKPLFRIGDGRYHIPYSPFLHNTLFTGLTFSFYHHSGIKELYIALEADADQQKNAFGNFKGEIGKQFSEMILFRNMMSRCFSDKHDCLAFFEDDKKFNPDAYYRRGNHIFIIEFKDYLLNADIIHSGSYETIRSVIDKKFVQDTVEKNGQIKLKDKGIYQLARNIETLAASPDLFYEIDTLARNKKLKLRNMHIHPVIIQTSFYFDFPGINYYLDGIIQDRLSAVRGTFKTIKPFTSIYLPYFIERLMLFTDGKIRLDEELEYYHNETGRLETKAERTFNPSDWIERYYPFSFFNSPQYRKQIMYRRKELLNTIEACWNLQWKEGLPDLQNI